MAHSPSQRWENGRLVERAIATPAAGGGDAVKDEPVVEEEVAPIVERVKTKPVHRARVK